MFGGLLSSVTEGISVFVGEQPTVHVEFDGSEYRPTTSVKKFDDATIFNALASELPFTMETLTVYTQTADITGLCTVTVPDGARLDHVGITLEIVGQLECYEHHKPFEFTAAIREVSGPGCLEGGATDFDFEFKADTVVRPYDSYDGIRNRVRYFARVKVERDVAVLKYDVMGLAGIEHVQNFWVELVGPPPEANPNIKTEVGIEDCLHLEIEFAKSKFHLGDVIIGKIDFLLVRIKVLLEHY
jgi:hypothetical protein